MKLRIRILVLALAAGAAAPLPAQVLRSFACDPQGGQCPRVLADANGSVPGVTQASITLGSSACDGGTAAVASVSVDLVHGHTGDLTLELVPPSGPAVQLLGRLDSPEGDPGGCSSDDLVARFSATGAVASCSADGTIPATAPEVRASGDLASIGTAIAPAGAWQLRVTDAVAGGYGLLGGWTLQLACDIDGTLFRDGFEE